MKIVFEVDGLPEKDDLLVFDGEKFKPVKKSVFLSELSVQFKKHVKDQEADMLKLKAEINEKLKAYHDVLQLLSKEE